MTRKPSLHALLLLSVANASIHSKPCLAFSGAAGGRMSIFGVPDAGWTSPDWNWGSPVGTGHDCAVACRRALETRERRKELVQDLIEGGVCNDDDFKEPESRQSERAQSLSFEEVKLVLALMWQKARRTEGLEAYGEILDEMAKAERYEADAGGDEESCSRLFVQDVQKRYVWLDPDVDDKIAMNLLWYETDDYDVARRRCCGLILKSMSFIEDGL